MPKDLAIKKMIVLLQQVAQQIIFLTIVVLVLMEMKLLTGQLLQGIIQLIMSLCKDV